MAKSDSPAAPPSLREQYKQLTHDRLVKAAQELFVMQGFRVTTVAQIAAAAGTTSTTFYRHFKNKGELAWLLRDQLTAEFQQLYARLDALPRWSAPAIRGWLNEYVEMWRRVHKLCDAFWEASTLDRDLATDILPDGIRLLQQVRRLAGTHRAAQQRALLRVAALILSLDRIAFMADCEGVALEQSTLLDVYAPLLVGALQDCLATTEKAA